MRPRFLKGKMHKLKTNLNALDYLINEDRSYRSDLGFAKRYQYLFKGFSNGRYGLYNFEENDSKDYLTDYQRRKTRVINGKYSIILDDKKLFETLLKDDQVVPKTFGTIARGNIVLQDKKASFDEFIELLQEHQTLIIKKIHGGGGKGVFKVDNLKDVYYLDNEEVSLDEFSAFIQNLEPSIISEFLRQAAYSNEIYPGTVNTIRMLTMKDPETNEAFFATAVHKFGSKKTEPADNVWKGGLTAKVNLETGVIGKPALHHKNNNEIEWVEVHPDTLVKIEGTKIPHWEEVKSSILELTNKLENIYYVGWDVVVTEDGYRIIEGNNYSDVNILQIHEPLLVNERVRAFYKHHGII